MARDEQERTLQQFTLNKVTISGKGGVDVSKGTKRR